MKLILHKLWHNPSEWLYIYKYSMYYILLHTADCSDFTTKALNCWWRKSNSKLRILWITNNRYKQTNHCKYSISFERVMQFVNSNTFFTSFKWRTESYINRIKITISPVYHRRQQICVINTTDYCTFYYLVLLWLCSNTIEVDLINSGLKTNLRYR